MKKIFFIIALLIATSSAFAQIESPVKWSYAAKKLSSTEAVVFIKATIQDGWQIYSLNVKDGGPIKTSFTFNPSNETFCFMLSQSFIWDIFCPFITRSNVPRALRRGGLLLHGKSKIFRFLGWKKYI